MSLHFMGTIIYCCHYILLIRRAIWRRWNWVLNSVLWTSHWDWCKTKWPLNIVAAFFICNALWNLALKIDLPASLSSIICLHGDVASVSIKQQIVYFPPNHASSLFFLCINNRVVVIQFQMLKTISYTTTKKVPRSYFHRWCFASPEDLYLDKMNFSTSFVALL